MKYSYFLHKIICKPDNISIYYLSYNFNYIINKNYMIFTYPTPGLYTKDKE